MKRILNIILILYYGLANAQNWCPSGAEWTYSGSTYSGESNLKLIYEKDTLVKQQLCKKIKGRLIKISYGPPGTPPKITDTLSTEPIFTYAKNDTVFFYYNNSFYSAYYFNAKLGDTLNYENPLIPSYPIKQVIDSVGVVNINSIPLKYYVTKNLSSDNDIADPQQTTIMERIGVLDNYIIPYYAPVTESYSSLICYKDDSFQLYQKYPTEPCDYISTIPKVLNENALKLRPNPATDKFSLSSSSNDKVQTILIYDLSARLRNKIDNTENRDVTEIDISNLENGMYFILLTSSSGATIVKKLIKE